jgi:hypothetical protein
MELFRHGSTAARATAAGFNAWTDRYRTELARFWYLTSFAVLFGVSAHAGYRAPLAQAAQAACGSICLAVPGFYIVAAAAWGGAAIVVAMAYARLLQALQPYQQREWRLELFGWCMLCIAVSKVRPLVGAHADGELFLGWYFGGFGINPQLGVVEFFWSKFAREQATSPDG